MRIRLTDCRKEKGRTGKDRKGNLSIYIAPIAQVVLFKRSGMDHTVLPTNYIMPALPS